jgi:hypothetical protein
MSLTKFRLLPPPDASAGPTEWEFFDISSVYPELVEALRLCFSVTCR